MKDRVAIITGSTSGIGEDMAIKFAQNGCKVVIVGRNRERGEAVEKRIKEEGGESFFFRADVSNATECKALFDKTIEVYNTVDILVNNVGITNNMPITEITEDAWDEVLKINLKSYFLCCREAIGIMSKKGYGRIVNISSRGWLGGSAQCNYAASKGGIVSLTRALALETAKMGITVNCVAPGMIDTPLHRKATPEEVSFRMKSQPMGKVGTPRQVTNATEYFAREENWFTTGQTLYVCGGMSVLASLSA